MKTGDEDILELSVLRRQGLFRICSFPWRTPTLSSQQRSVSANELSNLYSELVLRTGFPDRWVVWGDRTCDLFLIDYGTAKLAAISFLLTGVLSVLLNMGYLLLRGCWKFELCRLSGACWCVQLLVFHKIGLREQMRRTLIVFSSVELSLSTFQWCIYTW